MYINLEAEMARHRIGNKRIADVISKSERTVRNKRSGKTLITISEALIIKREIFPFLSVEYLFDIKK